MANTQKCHNLQRFWNGSCRVDIFEQIEIKDISLLTPINKSLVSCSPTPHKCRFTAWAFTKPKASKAWTWRLDFNEGFISFAAPYTKYRFTVRAFTKRREGPTSEALVVITDTEAPSPPRSVHKWRHNFFAKIWTLPLPIHMDSDSAKLFYPE